MFNIGEKVVCVNDNWQPWVRDTYNQLPVKGNTYTIRGVDLGRSDLGTLSSGESQTAFRVLLEELHNDDDITGSGINLGELGFKSDRFATLEQVSENEELQLIMDEAGTTVIIR